MSLIKAEGITKQYLLGNQTVDALRGISFDINQGEFIAIMGPSGSGKSTLMNIIGCLDTPTQGKYFLNQQEVSTFKGDELAKIRKNLRKKTLKLPSFNTVLFAEEFNKAIWKIWNNFIK